MFWNRKHEKEKEVHLPGPKSTLGEVGSYMVTKMNKKPDWVWQLRAVVCPTGRKKAFYCRVFADAQVARAVRRVKVCKICLIPPFLRLFRPFRTSLEGLSPDQIYDQKFFLKSTSGQFYKVCSIAIRNR